MPSTVPLQQTWPSLVVRKRNAAEKLERAAAQKRAEADDLQRRWEEYRARRDARVAP